jgi:hypothetical protein
MNKASQALIAWLKRKRRNGCVMAAVIALLALGTGTVVLLLTASLLFSVLFLVCSFFANSLFWPGLIAAALTAGIIYRSIRGRQENWLWGLDPLGFWMLKDFCSIGPRLLLEGLRHISQCGRLAELNIPACARALAFLAASNLAVRRDDLMRHCTELPWPGLKEQLQLIEGVLFIGDDDSRVSLMDPVRMRLRWMLKQDKTPPAESPAPPPEPETAPTSVSVNEPEKLSAYEILGLSAAASPAQIKTAYRTRVKECHPDRFAGMDPQALELAERWTKALNAAYSSLMARNR